MDRGVPIRRHDGTVAARPGRAVLARGALSVALSAVLVLGLLPALDAGQWHASAQESGAAPSTSAVQPDAPASPGATGEKASNKVKHKSRPYVLAVMTSACGQHAKLRKLVRLVDAVHADMSKSES